MRRPTALCAPKVEALARRAVDVWPFTALGMALAVVAPVALLKFGFEKLDLVLLVLGYGGIGLLAIATVLVASSALGLWWQLRRTSVRWSTSTLETGAPLPTGFSLPSLRWLPLVQVHWTWVSPDADVADAVAERGRLREHVTLLRRGIYPSI
ncbi:MAG: hypothetical protein JRF54_14565, partial [Deltaproteobacteria bacterium]|nr:hypothetical protein [Deltaproteobacteria bacterium]